MRSYRQILSGGFFMNKKKKQSILFHAYFKDWIELYKDGAVRPVTLQKYWINHHWLAELAPSLKLEELDRKSYQKLLNDFAVTHEKQTTMDFHHQIKGAVLDAHDEGLILHDPTRKVVIKGKEPTPKKLKFLSQFELRALLDQLSLTESISWDWFILLVAKTGIRFSEALALTPEDFDFSKQTLIISKTWNYKEPKGGFQPTKNTSSKRKIQLDWQTAMQFSQLLKNAPSNSPVFVDGRVFNSTINQRLATYCEKANIPIISMHGLRHTHASLLLYAGVTTASVARRLGHSNMTTTQQTYLHIIQELENQDNEKVMRHLSSLY